MAFGIGPKTRQIDDGELRHEVFKFRRLRADQQRADEQRMPGKFGKDPRLDPKTRVGAAVEILREQRHAFGMLEEVFVEGVELF